MKSIAVIGSGISGLGCCYHLSPHFDVTLIDGDDHIGGHSNTVVVEEQGRPIPIDTGFMVYNEVTYPRLTRLFSRLGVPTQPTSMSFSVQDRGLDLEFQGSTLNQVFAQRRNLLRPWFYRFLWEIQRFNTAARAQRDQPEWETRTLQDFVSELGLSPRFLQSYIVPMVAAIWSASEKDTLRFPAATLMRFFDNHGLLGGLSGHHPWRTVTGGSRVYVEKLLAACPSLQILRHHALSVEPSAHQFQVTTSAGAAVFDGVIFATPADIALKLGAGHLRPDLAPHLSHFQYQKNLAVLHTDPNLMPQRRLAWAAWNYRKEIGPDGGLHCSTHYWMNELQRVSDRQDYFVSINPPVGAVARERVLREIPYRHIVFSTEAIQSQSALRSSLGARFPGVACVGSYMRYGFHEDGLLSSEELCSTILREARQADLRK